MTSPEAGPSCRAATWDWLSQRLAYLGLFAGGIRCSLKEVKDNRYASSKMSQLSRDDLRAVSDDKNRAVLEAYVASLEADVKVRYDRVESKLKTLLGTNSIAFAAIGAFSLTGKTILFVAAVPVLVSALLALRALGVLVHQRLSLSAEEIRDADLWALALHSRMTASAYNDSVVDFFVDYFRAAHRLFMLGLTLLLVIYPAIKIISPHGDAPEIRVRIESIEARAADELCGAASKHSLVDSERLDAAGSRESPTRPATGPSRIPVPVATGPTDASPPRETRDAESDGTR